MAGPGVWFGISNACGGVWSKWVGQNREIDKEHDEDYAEEEFQLDNIKFDRDGEVVREALNMGNCSINIGELSLSKKGSVHSENNFRIFLLSGISNTAMMLRCVMFYNE